MGEKIVHTFIRILAKKIVSLLFFASHLCLNGDLAQSFVDYPVRAFYHDFQIPADYEDSRSHHVIEFLSEITYRLILLGRNKQFCYLS